ncbi:MAG TPA: PAS domain S-box protein [Bryobacteraceae bacterium]|nr:PAS domain S-box protein [Bryobacteraceae bacterium]
MTRVLVVDDSGENRYLLSCLLKGHGYAVEEAGNGAEALIRARQNPPDLTISDLLMPEVDGYTLLRYWRSDERLKRIPFIVYTATYTAARDVRLALALGADAFLIKPSEPDELMAAIQGILEKQQRGDLPSAHTAKLEELALLKDYNEVLIHKLEQKGGQLEQINRELREEITERKRTESALRDSEERYRKLFHAIADPLWVYDRETLAFLIANEAASAEYGYRLEEFMGMTIKDIRPPEEVPALLARLAQPGKDLEKRGVQRLRKKNGDIVEAEITAHSLDYLGRAAFLVQARDVTAKRRAEAEAARTSELLRAVSDQIPDAVYVKNRNGKYLLINHAAAQFFGRRAEEILGKDDAEFLGEESARNIMTVDRQVIETGQIQAADELLTASGTPRTFHTVKAPLRDRYGNVVGVIGISRDFTERRQAEEAIRLRDRAMQAVSQGILITDVNQPDNPIVYASPGFARMTGYQPEEVLGKNCRFLQGKDTDPRVVESLREAVAAGRGCEVEILNYRKDGTPFWNALSLNPVHNEKGGLAYFVGVQSDVTKHKQLEEQLRQAQKMEAVGRLAGGVAHDFNNLLMVINGYAELLAERPDLIGPAGEELALIRETGERAASLTRQLLAFSRRQVMNQQVLNMNTVISGIEKMLRRLIGEDILLETVLDPALGHIQADPGQIEQVIMNLVVNARDSMPSGGKVTIETSNVVLDEAFVYSHVGSTPGLSVRFVVRDTGIGIEPETMERIFEPFFTTKEPGRGTGLGLSTVYGIVKQMGGSIGVESEVGRGTTFTLYFPAVEQVPVHWEAPEAEALPEGAKTILLMEDEVAVRSLVLRVLEGAGFHILAPRDAEHAFTICKAHDGPIDLLLTDVVMPGISGPKIAQQVRSLRPEIRVVYMSGYTDHQVLHDEVLNPQVNLLQKPFTAAVLLKKVKDALARE